MERIRRIAGKCPVHRTLASEAKVSITDHVEVEGMTEGRQWTSG